LVRTPKGKYTHCTFGVCDDPHYAKGLCRRHYLRRLAGRPMDGSTRSGEAHGKAKLTDTAVRQIRRLHQQGTRSAALAEMYGVSSDAVRDIIRGRTWKRLQ
jgi:hypothetical protein